jgi:hypothetical protein
VAGMSTNFEGQNLEKKIKNKKKITVVPQFGAQQMFTLYFVTE